MSLEKVTPGIIIAYLLVVMVQGDVWGWMGVEGALWWWEHFCAAMVSVEGSLTAEPTIPRKELRA